MTYTVLIDESVLSECIQSNIYQSVHFEAGLRLSKALSGDKGISTISPRIVPCWKKNTLYLLQSRKTTGYLLFDSCVFANVQGFVTNENIDNSILLIFQRVCRFAYKRWNKLSLSSPAEQWLPRMHCGVVFPFPFSQQTGFRVTIRPGYSDRRIETRHGSRHLFAFAAGTNEEKSSQESEIQYKRSFEGLQSVRAQSQVEIENAEDLPEDGGYHPLILGNANHPRIKYQEYEKWMMRLTSQQKQFIESTSRLPQRVEGPAGTGKTLSLILRAHFLCMSAEKGGEECKVLFISHSRATRDALEVIFASLGFPNYVREGTTEAQAIELRTLQEWCGQFLGERDIGNAQYLDQDALEAKNLRKLIIKEVLETRLREDKEALEYLSKPCRSLFEGEVSEYLAELLQHEIGVMIKGRAEEKLENYLLLQRLAYCIPTECDNDRRYIFSLYKEYQKHLNSSGVFDTDDIVLSALGRLNTPIWRRRKETEGYDAIIIDETHLFNLNELSVFHLLLKRNEKPQIIFSIDRSQAPGERGITTQMVREVLTGSFPNEQETKTELIFRCSAEVVRLAEAITAAGATLFTTFENPLIDVTSISLEKDESLSRLPIYWKCPDDERMCAFVSDRIKQIRRELKCRTNEILIVGMSVELLPRLRKKLEAGKVKFVEVLQRGDLKTVMRGEQEGAVILSHPDFVGGLEFQAVLIVGVDDGRVPPTEGALRQESRHFLEFRACNRLYVAISRARLCVELFYSNERGTSKLLDHAIEVEAVRIEEQG